MPRDLLIEVDRHLTISRSIKLSRSETHLTSVRLTLMILSKRNQRRKVISSPSISITIWHRHTHWSKISIKDSIKSKLKISLQRQPFMRTNQRKWKRRSIHHNRISLKNVKRKIQARKIVKSKKDLNIRLNRKGHQQSQKKIKVSTKMRK